MRNKYRRIPFSPEALKWYRRITSIQLTLGLLAILFLIWARQNQQGQLDLAEAYIYPETIRIQDMQVCEDQLYVLEDNGIGYLNGSGYQEELQFEPASNMVSFSILENDIFTLSFDGETLSIFNRGEKASPQTFPLNYGAKAMAYDSNQDSLYLSDGSSVLKVLDPDGMKLQEEIRLLRPNNEEVTGLSHLTFDGQHLYALLENQSTIVQIKLGPFNRGRIVKSWDLSQALLNKDKKLGVLTSLAHLEGDRFLITGENYPFIYELRLE